MALLPDEDRRRAWARFMRDNKFFAFPGTISKSDARAAVDAVDAWMDANAGSYNTALPLPYRTEATADQKALLLAGLALRRAGQFRTLEDEGA